MQTRNYNRDIFIKLCDGIEIINVIYTTFLIFYINKKERWFWSISWIEHVLKLLKNIGSKLYHCNGYKTIDFIKH